MHKKQFLVTITVDENNKNGRRKRERKWIVKYVENTQ